MTKRAQSSSFLELDCAFLFCDIQRTAHAEPDSVEDMGVDHDSPHIAMFQQLLHGSDIVAVLKQMGGETRGSRQVCGYLILEWLF